MGRIKPQALLQQSKKKKEPARISITTIVLCSVIAILVIYFLFTAYRNVSQRSEAQTHNSRLLLERHTFLDLKTSDLPRYAIITTAKGPVTVELFKDRASEAVGEFINFCQKGHINEMLIQHVRRHRMNLAKNGNTEDWRLEGNHYSQHDTSSIHESFLLGTPKVKNKHGGFQLFVTTTQTSDQDTQLIILGRVVNGKRVIQEIKEIGTDEHYSPGSPIEITGVSLHKKM